MSGIKLFQQNFGHAFLPIMNVDFFAFKDSSERALSEAFILIGKVSIINNIIAQQFFLDFCGSSVTVAALEVFVTALFILKDTTVAVMKI